MTTFLLIALPVAVFFVLLAYGVEIAWALGVTSVVGLLIFLNLEPTIGYLETTPYRTAASYTLTTIPLFLLMAEFATRSGIIARLFVFAERAVSGIRGGLAYAVVLAGSMMGALSGSSIGATGAVSRLAVPQMSSRGYNDRLVLGVVASAGTLAVMIPPSIGLILFGVLTETSVGALFMAGVVPGLMTAVAYGVVIFCWTRIRPQDLPQGDPVRYSWTEKRRALGPVWPFLVIVVVVVGSIYGGLTTATEAAGLGAVATLLVWLGISALNRKNEHERPQRFSRSALSASVDATIRTTVMILMLVIAAAFIGYFLTVTGVTRAFGAFMLGLDLPPLVIVLMLVAMFLVLGCFLSQIEVLVLTLPVVMPVVLALGYEPVWFGIVAIKMVEVGLVTPPVGMNCFIASGAVPGKRVGDAFRGASVFLLADAAVIALIIVFPEIVLALPRQAGLI
ncbi:TRAP transporter large permease [Nocardiopsis sp. HNM0947]|uniref:TRAP transporter large permease n=1 Tax=Nocardiopsis coralli TaxID=2772213 RepID=A0ABR9P355_9ACTN|nr:TRAP transporter large permease [Nocardiopsis coralli]MBE2998282.1 TRAP transporter large permease [Nocardiopsis coralli]